MQQKTITSIKTILGIFLIIFGIAGMILPILPGWWVAIIGLELLGWKLVFDRKKPWLEMIKLKWKDESKPEE